MDNNCDVLKVYFGDPIEIDDYITIYQPTIGEILEFGEKEFWHIANQLCANTTSMRLPLWKAGIDWNKFDDFELFIMLTSSMTKDKTSMFFGDIDFTKFDVLQVPTDESEDTKELIMIYQEDANIQINKELYNSIVNYLRIITGIYPKVEKTKSKATKESIIYEEEQNIRNEQRKHKNDKWEQSLLFPLISACLNHPGFKYKKNELREVGIFEFMDSVKRLQIYENTMSFMTGMYMGMMDTSKIDLNKELNWARDLYNS